MERSHIWIGVFGPDAPEDFFDEQYEDEASPISAFAASQGERWIDHDWLERSWHRKSRRLSLLMKRHSYSEDYADLVIDRAAEIGIQEANVFVMCDEAQIRAPVTVSRPGMTLHFIGTFTCGV